MKHRTWLHFCPYCGKVEITTKNQSMTNQSHTHFPGKDISQKGWTNVYSVSTSLWRFDTLKELKKALNGRPDLRSLYETVKKT